MNWSNRRFLGMAVAVYLVTCACRTLAADGIWTNNANGVWSTAACWANGVVADGATYTATFAGPTGGITADRTVTNDTNRTIGHLCFTNGNNDTWMIAGTNLIFDANGTGGGTSVVYVASSTKAQLGLYAGTNTIMKTGTGQLLLATSNNVCTGTLVVAEGSLRFNNLYAAQNMNIRLDPRDNNCTLDVSGLTSGNRLAAKSLVVPNSGAGIVTITNNATLAGIGCASTFDKTVIISLSGTLTLNAGIGGAGGIYKTGPAALYMQNTVNPTYAGPTTLSQGTIYLSAYSSYFTVLPAGNTVEMGDVNTGANALVLDLYGVNTVLPNINLHVTTNGTSATLLNGLSGQGAGAHSVKGSIQIDRAFLTCGCTTNGTSLIVSSLVWGVGGLWVTNGTGYATSLAGTNAYTGGTLLANGILRTRNASALGSNQVVMLATTNVVLDLTNTALTVDSLSSGIVTPAIANQGAGFTSTPTVVISGGGGAGAAAAAIVSGGKVTAITVTNYGVNYRSAPTFTLSGGNPSTPAVITGVFDPSSVTLGSGTLTISGPQAGSAAYAGSISGTGSFVMNGSGAQYLTGSNTYSGTTTVSNGALFVDGALVGTGGVVSVRNGAILGGTGQVQRVVTVESNGVLAAAATNSIGVLTIATNLNLKSGAVLDIELSGPSACDQVVVQGTPNLNSDSGVGSVLRLTAAGRIAGWQSFKIIDNQSTQAVLGRFVNERALSVMTDSGLVRLSVNYAGGSDGNDVVLTAIGNGTALFFR